MAQCTNNTQGKNNDGKTNHHRNNSKHKQKKNKKANRGSPNKQNDSQSNNRFRFKHKEMHRNHKQQNEEETKNDDQHEYDTYFAYNYKHYVKDSRIANQYVLFYKDVFSQWFPAKMVIENVEYANCEQYMMAEKARLFNDDEYWELITNETDPSKIKKLGRGVRGFNETIWKQHRENIVYRANLAKFTQNEILKKKLLSYDRELYFVEASGVDRIWGIGLKVTDPRAGHKRNWQGLNLLGKAITRVRDDILAQNLQ